MHFTADSLTKCQFSHLIGGVLHSYSDNVEFCKLGAETDDITQTHPCNILQYFMAVKIYNFQMKNCDIFLIFAQNIDCGYTLELPQ